MDYELVIFLILLVVGTTCAFLFPLKCPGCKTKLKFEVITDAFGINITKRLVIKPGTGISDSYYSCPKCGKYFKERSNKLQEVEKVPRRFIVFPE